MNVGRVYVGAELRIVWRSTLLKVESPDPGLKGDVLLGQMVRELIIEYLCEVQSSMFRQDHDAKTAK